MLDVPVLSVDTEGLVALCVGCMGRAHASPLLKGRSTQENCVPGPVNAVVGAVALT